MIRSFTAKTRAFSKIRLNYKPLSMFSTNDTQIIDQTKEDINVPSYLRKLKSMSYLLYLPLAYSSGVILFDAFTATSFSHYKVTQAINNILLINCYNTGVVYGYRDSLTEKISGNEIYIQFMYTGASFVLSHLLTTASVPIYVFCPMYYLMLSLSTHITMNMNHIYPGYSKHFNLILIVSMVLILIAVSCRYTEWRGKIEDAKKIGEIVNLHRYSTDSQFKERMNYAERYLDELSLKLAKN